MEKIETWHVGLSCQYTHFMSFSSKSEHVTVADQATLNGSLHHFFYLHKLQVSISFEDETRTLDTLYILFFVLKFSLNFQ